MTSEDFVSECPADRLRNICILAHVDHGKTTCADNLICANGIISRHSAGKIRYLDSRQDEQERQITMKSSAIALKYAAPGKPAYMVNLIDSPGHVDFTSEVSTAARLADGALVVVDVVEGVEAQTRTVLRQAWRDRVKTILFLNKVDRLIVELELTPMEAYERLLKIVEQINAVNQQLLSEEIMAKDTDAPADGGAGGTGDDIDLTAVLDYDEATEEAWRYSPERGNVAFGSASHGWAFRIDTFAQLVANKMGASPAALQRALWGEWTYSMKTKRATRRNPTDTKAKPMFVQFVLEQLWRVYGGCYSSLDPELLSKMQSQIPAWKELDLSRLIAGQSAARELMSRWLPFASCVLKMAVDHLPSPVLAAPSRLPVLCPRWFAMDGADQQPDETCADSTAQIKEALRASDPSGPAVAYLAKFLGVDLQRLVLTGDALLGDEDVQFVGLCRVFSGTLRPGQDLFVMSTDDAEACAEGHGRSVRVLRLERIFMLKGRYLEEAVEAAAGSIIAAKVAQVETGESGPAASELGVERCLTLCSMLDGPCFETPYSTQAFSIVRVNIEPKQIVDAEALYRGLRLLHRADPSVTVDVRVTGENVLGCCGDEHLKRCITDLQNMYARGIPLSISPPLVAVREAIAATVAAERLDPKMPMWLPSWAAHLADASTEASSHFSKDHDDHVSETGVEAQDSRISMSANGTVSVWTANRKACFRVSAIALPSEVMEWMDSNADEIETVVHRQRVSPAFTVSSDSSLPGCLREVSRQFGQTLVDAGIDACGTLSGISVTKGSRTVLIDASGSEWQLWESSDASTLLVPDATALLTNASGGDSSEAVPRRMRTSVLAGFQLASTAGPLCEEPMRGVGLIIHACQVVRTAPQVGEALEEGGASAGYAPTEAALARAAAAADPYGPMSGQVMVATKEACRCCLFRRGFARICEAMLSLEVQCEQEMLGKVYAVLGKRRVQVLQEGLREGTSLFCISSFLPLADSFGLAQDLRQAASGQVSFHCAFSHWEQSEEDPFQETSLTPQEIEDLGDQPLPPNVARKLIDAIRKRKGLATDEKVVSSATKQRTVTRNK